jgi:hypothetical protein
MVVAGHHQGQGRQGRHVHSRCFMNKSKEDMKKKKEQFDVFMYKENRAELQVECYHRSRQPPAGHEDFDVVGMMPAPRSRFC